MASSVDDTPLHRVMREVSAALVHKARLLRFRNWLCSPLLRLPTEIIVRILSFIMAELDSFMHRTPWRPIHLICHRIRRIMCDAAEVWWRVDCACIIPARFIFAWSRGDPRVILSDLRSMEEHRLSPIEKTLDHWKDKQGFRGHRLRTLKFYGSVSSFDHFSWILERPLPRLDSLTINIMDLTEEDYMEPLPSPVTLKLPVDLDVPLQVLDLRNIMLPWSSHSHLFNRLRELRLSFRDCYDVITIPEDDLFNILGASPQLEHLSLLQVGHEVPVRNGRPLPPNRILQFPNLVSLTLDNNPMVVKHTLSYMDLSTIDSLRVRSYSSWDEVDTVIDLLFPDDRLLSRLFPNPPTFAVRDVGLEELGASIEIDIGSVGLRLDFPIGEGEHGGNIVMSCILNLVPPSVTTLKLEYTALEEREWRDFFMSHPEVRSIECAEFWKMPISRTFWDGLSPVEEEGIDVPCPGLESIVVVVSCTPDSSFTPLSDCLRNRQTAGFKLRHLKMMDHRGFLADVEGFNDEFGPLVERAEAEARIDRFRDLVRSFTICRRACVDWPLVGPKILEVWFGPG